MTISTCTAFTAWRYRPLTWNTYKKHSVLINKLLYSEMNFTSDNKVIIPITNNLKEYIPYLTICTTLITIPTRTHTWEVTIITTCVWTTTWWTCIHYTTTLSTLLYENNRDKYVIKANKVVTSLLGQMESRHAVEVGMLQLHVSPSCWRHPSHCRPHSPQQLISEQHINCTPRL